MEQLKSDLQTTSSICTNYCELCHHSFSTKGNLKNHISTIHKNIRPFKCPYQNCDKSYSNKSRLDVHIRTHTGEKPYVCPICGKSFNEKGNLKTHEGFHSSLRPFKCPYCSKTYKTNGHLKDHIQVQHIKVRKFKCEICKNEFGRNSTLLAHLRTHKKAKKENEEEIENTTTRPESKATLVNNTTTVEEEKQFWNVDNEDLFSLALGEGNSNENNHVFDINFDQGQNCITSSNNNSINENQSDEIIFF